MEPLYVPDPTVIVKWALQPAEDKEQDRSLDLLHLWLEGGCQFLLPSHWLAEVGSLLGQLFPQRSPELMELLIGFGFPEARHSGELYRTALQLAGQGAGYYGALYHAVALQHGGTLITTNVGYWRKTRATGGVMLLKDFNAQ